MKLANCRDQIICMRANVVFEKRRGVGGVGRSIICTGCEALRRRQCDYARLLTVKIVSQSAEASSFHAPVNSRPQAGRVGARANI